jgi:hypothetical protein
MRTPVYLISIRCVPSRIHLEFKLSAPACLSPVCRERAGSCSPACALREESIEMADETTDRAYGPTRAVSGDSNSSSGVTCLLNFVRQLASICCLLAIPPQRLNGRDLKLTRAQSGLALESQVVQQLVRCEADHRSARSVSSHVVSFVRRSQRDSAQQRRRRPRATCTEHAPELEEHTSRPTAEEASVCARSTRDVSSAESPAILSLSLSLSSPVRPATPISERRARSAVGR